MSTHGEAVEDIKKAKDLVDSLDLTQTYGEQYAEQYPDARKHKIISFVKSGFRIAAGVCLVVGLPVWCGVGLIVAEVLGIAEELV